MKKIENLKKIYELVQRVAKVVQDRYPGIEIERIRELLQEVKVAIEDDRISEALELAKAAEETAFPDIIKLLQKLETAFMDAEAARKGKNYRVAIEVYERLLDLCGQYRELAKLRGEFAAIEKIEELEQKIKENLNTALTERDFHRLNEKISKANELLTVAEQEVEEKRFDEALDKLRHAERSLQDALKLALDHELSHAGKIQASLNMVRDRQQQILKERIRFSIETADDPKISKSLIRTIKRLKLPDADKKALEILAQTKTLDLHLKIAENFLRKSENLASQSEDKLPKAIEECDQAKQWLQQALELALEWELLEKKKEIDRLLDEALKIKKFCEKKLLKEPVVPLILQPRFVSPFEKSFFDKLNNRYVMQNILGEGAFAWVFKAQKRDTGELVAVKVFKSLSKDAEESFTREIDVWSKLDHENIVKRRAWGISPPFIEMELANSSLAKLKKPLPLRKVCRYGFEICRALNHAHSKGIYHRDLKPSNLLLFGDKVKVSDWGLARLTGYSASTSLREAGTIFYMAPEQFEEKGADARTDIYQLGVVLYELITARRPFEGDTDPVIMRKILHEEPPKPSLLNPEAGKLEPVILKCLEKEPEKRFQTARELQYAIADIMSREFGERLEFSKRKEDRPEKVRWLAELAIVYLELSRTKMSEISRALGYSRALQEETRSKELDELCQELEARLREGVGVPEDRLREIESVLLKYAV